MTLNEFLQRIPEDSLKQIMDAVGASLRRHEGAVHELRDEIIRLQEKLESISGKFRKKPKKSVRLLHLQLLEKNGGLCPCGRCPGKPILIPGPGPLIQRFRGAFDHFWHRSKSELHEIWPISEECNNWAEKGNNRDALAPAFSMWQRRLSEMHKTDKAPLRIVEKQPRLFGS